MSGDTWHHSCWMSIMSAFRVVGKVSTACSQAILMVRIFDSKAFHVPSLMSGTLHLHVYSRLLSVLVCLSLSLFLSLSLSLSFYIYICDHRLQQQVWGYACDPGFATNLSLVLKSSPNRFEHRERNLVLQASEWLSYIFQMIPLWFSLVCYVFHCFPMYSCVYLWLLSVL